MLKKYNLKGNIFNYLYILFYYIVGLFIGTQIGKGIERTMSWYG